MNQSPPADTTQLPVRGIRFMGIQMPPGLHRRNLLTYFFVTLIAASYAGLLASLEPALFQLIGIPVEQQGAVTGLLRTLQEVAYILLLGFYGVVSDRVGRAPVYIFGFVLTAFGYLLYPFADGLLQLALFRIVIGVGGAAMVGMMVTTVADYTLNETRSWANGLQALCGALGSFIPPVLALLPKQLVAMGYEELEALQMAFFAAAGLGLVAALLAWIGLSRQRAAPVVSESVFVQLKAGIAAAKDPGIALSYGASFIARGDLVITAAFASLWLVQVGTQQLGLSPSEASATIMFPRLAAILFGTLFGGILMGAVGDRIGRVNSVKLVSVGAAVTFIGLSLLPDPTHPFGYVLFFFMGMVEMAAFVAGQALVGERAPEARRGAIFGVFGIAGAFGIFMGGAVGGLLFSGVSPNAPFLLFGLLNILVYIWAATFTKKISDYDKLTDSEKLNQ